MTRNIVVGYQKSIEDQFISNLVYTNNFLDILSHFVKVLTFPTRLEKMDLRKFEGLNIDYLLVDIKNFGLTQFILREKNRVNIPFIIILHTVYSWFIPLVFIIPLIRREDIILAPSQYAKNSFLKISSKLKVHVIPHCLDIRKIQKTISPNSKNRRVITFMGRLTKDKGIENLIDCMPKIISRVGDVRLNIIGPLSGGSIKNGSPKSIFVSRLERKIRKLKLTNNVFFRGLHLGLNKYKTLSKSDIFAYPTIYQGENIPMSILEALACNVPVIATNWAGNKELITEGENGYLVNVNFNKHGKIEVDRDQIVSLVVKMFQDKRLAFKMKKNASLSALEYDFHNIMPRLTRLLKRKTYVETNNNRWELLQNKNIMDFKDRYTKRILYFIYVFGLANTTYKVKDLKTIKTKIMRKISYELFTYLCSSTGFRVGRPVLVRRGRK